jgi:hypothetical protein
MGHEQPRNKRSTLNDSFLAKLRGADLYDFVGHTHLPGRHRIPKSHINQFSEVRVEGAETKGPSERFHSLMSTQEPQHPTAASISTDLLDVRPDALQPLTSI